MNVALPDFRVCLAVCPPFLPPCSRIIFRDVAVRIKIRYSSIQYILMILNSTIFTLQAIQIVHHGLMIFDVCLTQWFHVRSKESKMA